MQNSRNLSCFVMPLDVASEWPPQPLRHPHPQRRLVRPPRPHSGHGRRRLRPPRSATDSAEQERGSSLNRFKDAVP